MALSVYLYLPNLIGYVRILLAFVGYAYALSDYRVTVGVYLLSQLLDAADGYAARVMGQSSTFGAVLDMVTDRTSTTCLCVVLAHFYPRWIPGFTALVALDMFSHWYHMYASLLLGGKSHKEVTNRILAVYYWKPVLFVACAGTEMWYVALYALAHSEGPMVFGLPLFRTVFIVCTPICALKQVCNVVQGVVAADALVQHDMRTP